MTRLRYTTRGLSAPMWIAHTSGTFLRRRFEREHEEFGVEVLTIEVHAGVLPPEVAEWAAEHGVEVIEA